MKKLLIAALSLVATASHAEVNFFADASTVVAYSGDVKSEKYPIALQTGILHRSNVDLTGREYYFNGLFIGASFRHCLYSCKGLAQ